MCLALISFERASNSIGIIYTVKTQIIRAKIKRLNHDIVGHLQSKLVKKLIKSKLLINLGQLWLSLAQLSPRNYLWGALEKLEKMRTTAAGDVEN